MIFFPKNNPEALVKDFSLLISDGKLSRFAQTIAASGRRFAKNMLASECISGYARLLENVLNFPSDALLPGPISQLNQRTWEWNLFWNEMVLPSNEFPNVADSGSSFRNLGVVYALEEEFKNLANSKNISEDGNGNLEDDIPNQQDWDILEEIENSEEYERVETEEVCDFLGLALVCKKPITSFFLSSVFCISYGILQIVA